MKISILGTGTVGRTLAGRLADLGHEIVIGTRDPAATMARTGRDAMGAPPYAGWQEQHPAVTLASAQEACARAELLINATSGAASVAALDAAAVADRDGLILMDVANALDFSSTPPRLAVPTTDSLGEQIQRAFPNARVVKALNTMNCEVMADPARLPGEHVVFVAGDDAGAKDTVAGLLRELGWNEATIIDLGGLIAARGTEMFMPLWLSIMQATGTTDFNINIVRS